MYSFEFNTIADLKENQDLKLGFFLCIWHANKIPPHIGVLIDGFYYSLKVKGKDTKIPVQEIIKLINRKSICTVFVEINLPINQQFVEDVFSNYDFAVESKSTCLTPITEIFNLVESISQLSDLLKHFNEKNQIGQVFGLNLTSDFKGILSYGKEEIEARLKQLSKTLN